MATETEKELEILKEIEALKQKMKTLSAEEAQLAAIDYKKLLDNLELEKQIASQRKEGIKTLSEEIGQLTETRRLTQDKKEATKLNLELAQKHLEISKKELEDLEKQGIKDQKKIEDAKKLVEEREKELKKQQEINKQLEIQKEQTEKLKELGKGIVSLAETLTGTYGTQITSMFKMNSLMSSFANIVSEIIKTNETLAATTGKVGLMTGDMGRGLEEYAVGYKEFGEAFGALYTEMADFSNLNEPLRKNLTENAAKMNNLGISAATTGKNFNNLTKSLNFGASEVDKINNKLAKSAIGAGIAPKKMADDFATYMPKLAAHGKKAVDIFIDLQKQSKNLGMEVGTLMSIVGDTFDQFESGAEAAGRLNAILGGDYLNSVEMLNATESERVDMLKRSFEMSGKNWESLDRFEKKAIATSLGISDMNEAGKLFGNTTAEMRAEMSKQAASNEELEKAQKASADTSRQLALAFNELLFILKPVAEGIKEFSTWLAGDTLGAGIFKVVAAVVAFTSVLRGLYIISGLQALLSMFGITMTKTGAETAAGGAGMAEGITAIGTAATGSALGLLALGGSIALIGLGIAAVVLSMAELVKSFSKLNGLQIAGALGAMALGFGAMALGLKFLIPLLIASIPATAAASWGLMAVGGAIALIGVGIGAAAVGMSKLVDSIVQLTSQNINLDNLEAITTVIGDITKAILDMPDTVKFKANVDALKSVGQTIQIAAESAPFIAPAKEFIVAAKEYHVAQKESKGVDNDALVAAIRSSVSTVGGKTTGLGAGTPIVIQINNATSLKGYVLGDPAHQQ